MFIDKTLRIASLAAIAAAMPAFIAIAAHAQAPAPASDGAPAARSETTPATPAGAIKVSPPAASKDAAAASSTTRDVTVGAAVIGSDGATLGEVKGVKSDPSGTVEEIHVKTGGILGFGGKVVVIPAAKIAKGGKPVLVAVTAADIGKLPPLADKKG
ncbi:MAG: mechanosensitive ion channel family protein [Hyphomicrobium sp.]|nr:mechanosensitive ion channel family protein [Hyphomicrobium sp.]